MMQVWIVWFERPIAVFSSEARARAYLARHGREAGWCCYAAEVNPDGLDSLPYSQPAAKYFESIASAH
ncbi:hypothetical protein [Uliginosibacterium sediminicola]|jgi:hypothetical protein|uniref:DUF3303 domain-containing protein n=1 Tax=Uliginosibacterium sediminicola TaxID=2024550 RepID=A0ABU9YUK4_9RHOO